jgi:lipoprotein-anchoring transpeptidase ErfK/SrfK
MQRAFFAFGAWALTMCGSGHADPLVVFQRQQSAPVQQTAAYGSYGGGFIEFLFGGGGRRAEPRYDRYPAFPADLGPGVVEAPDQPGRFIMDSRYVRQVVSYSGSETPGTIIINTQDRMLYLVQGSGRAIRYGIGVGRPGFTWSGVHQVSQKREWPDWTPPEEMLRRRPDLPRHMNGGPENPLGARALYLGSTLYRIHGSNEPWTIGTQVSSGCIRMRNEDVIDLYDRVKLGTKVVVL